MSVLERYKQRSAYKKSEDTPFTPIPESVYQPSVTEQSLLLDRSTSTDGATLVVPQLSFTNDPINPVSDQGLATSAEPGQSVALVPQDSINRQLALPAQASTKVLREPTFIRGTGKKSSGTLLAPKVSGKRTMTHAAIVVITIIVVVGALSAVLPLTSDGHAAGIGSLVSSIMGWSQTKNSNTALVPSQIATATAVTQDGYDQGPAVYAGVQSAPTVAPVSSGGSSAPSSTGSLSASDQGSLNRFFYGQCTYWANMRYHQLTGHWVPWLGNANAWASQAAAYGWVVSSTPHIPSIVAFAPYVDGAGFYGHVAIAESVSGNNVSTSNWNVYGSAWATTTYLTIQPGPGVLFLYYPGA